MGGRLVEVELETERLGDVTLCRVAGDLDAAAAPRARDAFSGLVGRRRIVLDLEGVVFIDSAGLGVLISAVRRIREAGGEIGVSARRPTLVRVLQLAGFDRLVPLTDSVREAIAQLPSSRAATPGSSAP